MSPARRLIVREIGGDQAIESGIPYIPAKFNGRIPEGQLYEWCHPVRGEFVGLKWVESGDGQALEIVENFNLLHFWKDGRCLIPWCDENELMLMQLKEDAQKNGVSPAWEPLDAPMSESIEGLILSMSPEEKSAVMKRFLESSGYSPSTTKKQAEKLTAEGR